MSYCRWGDDSDVYVYSDVRGGWTTWVAARRKREGYIFSPANVVKDMEDGYVDIDLPYVGKGFNDATLAKCIARLEDLRALGYAVPQYALDRLRKELAEDAARAAVNEVNGQVHPCGWHPGDCAAAGSGCDACGNNPEVGI
jgi:hypothetical protein